MSEASIYLTQIKSMSDTLGIVVDEVSADQFNQRPGSHLNPVGWNYFHLLRIWDLDMNWICKGQKREEDAWHRGDFTEKSGYSPDGKGGSGLGVGYGYTDAEVDEIRMGKDVLKLYHKMLMAETGDYLGSIDDNQLHRQIPRVLRPGEMTSAAEQIRHVIAHSYGHTGEMRYAMGVLGMRDPSYPGN